MASSYSRKKQPEVVRRALLDCAAKLAHDKGLAGLSLDAVARAAGVTKGGLFHHFENKQALVEGVFGDILDQLDARIDALIAKDPMPRGCFTRAYVRSTFARDGFGIGSRWATLAISMVVEPGLRRMWGRWLKARLQRHAETDSDPMLEVVRLAADGAWFGGVDQPRRSGLALRDRLLGLCD